MLQVHVTCGRHDITFSTLHFSLIQYFIMYYFVIFRRYNKRQKKDELAVLLQGSELPPAHPVADEPLLPAKSQMDTPPTHLHEPHTYPLPVNTAGQVRVHRRPILPATTFTITSASSAPSVPPSPMAPYKQGATIILNVPPSQEAPGIVIRSFSHQPTHH